MYNGIISIYKEAGFTSHDVVAKMRGILKQKKIGHTGTLDPQATGVLPVCLGTGTKLCDMLTDQNKEYEAKLLLGVETDTQDLTGKVLAERKVEVSEAQVREAILRFQGEYDQIPPMYSALKVNGKKLYELAREGKEVERKARRVTIYDIEVLSMDLPEVTMRVACSKGTYIRTLCFDIGTVLGCGGTMASLKRTKAAGFLWQEAITLGELETLAQEGRCEERIYPVDKVFEDYPALHMKPESLRLVENGNAFFLSQTEEGASIEGTSILTESKAKFSMETGARIYDTTGRFYGIYALDTETSKMKPVKMFLEKN